MVALSMFSSHPNADSSRRASDRAPVTGHVCYLSENRIVLVRQGDVSFEGAFVASMNPDPVGTVATIRIECGGRSFFGEAEVVRVSYATSVNGKGPGMGLKFRALTGEQKRALATLIGAQA
jgi:hypothetical protein